MTDSERLWTGVVLSLFMHFSLTLFHEAPPEETPALRVVLAVDESSSLTPKGTRQGTGLHAASPHDREEAEKLDRKRRAYLRYIEDVDAALSATCGLSHPPAGRSSTPRPCAPCARPAGWRAAPKSSAPTPSMFPCM